MNEEASLSSLSSIPLCDIHYSPILRCGGQAYRKHDGRYLCLHHIVKIKQQEECSICFNQLSDDTSILLKCGHMFHLKCMTCCRTPQCPLCRKQLEPIEAITTAGKDVIYKLAIQLYSLPSDKIKTAISCIKIVLKICVFAPKEIYDVLRLLIK